MGAIYLPALRQEGAGVKQYDQPPCGEDFSDPPPPIDQTKVDLVEALL